MERVQMKEIKDKRVSCLSGICCVIESFCLQKTRRRLWHYLVSSTIFAYMGLCCGSTIDWLWTVSCNFAGGQAQNKIMPFYKGNNNNNNLLVNHFCFHFYFKKLLVSVMFWPYFRLTYVKLKRNKFRAQK